MTRKELANKAFEIIRKDLGNERSEKEVWQAIAETDDESLYAFLVSPKIRNAVKRGVYEGN